MRVFQGRKSDQTEGSREKTLPRHQEETRQKKEKQGWEMNTEKRR